MNQKCTIKGLFIGVQYINYLKMCLDSAIKLAEAVIIASFVTTFRFVSPYNKKSTLRLLFNRLKVFSTWMSAKCWRRLFLWAVNRAQSSKKWFVVWLLKPHRHPGFRIFLKLCAYLWLLRSRPTRNLLSNFEFRIGSLICVVGVRLLRGRP